MDKKKKSAKPIWHGARFWLCLGLIAMMLVATLGLFRSLRSAREGPAAANAAQALDTFDGVFRTLSQHILADPTLENTVSAELQAGPDKPAGMVVFLTLSDGEKRADVVSARADTLEQAFSEAAEAARALVRRSGLATVYLKADIVNYMEKIDTAALPGLLNGVGHDGYFRYGIAFDAKFDTAFLESELNGNNMLDYGDSGEIRLNRLNRYLGNAGRKDVSKVPNNIWLFSCRGYLYDGEECLPLMHEQTPFYGRRSLEGLWSEDFIKEVIANNVEFLVDSVEADGSFVYGCWPISGNDIDSYNILRHAGTIWTLVNQYSLTGDARLIPYIDSTIDYLLKELVYEDTNTAYILERKDNEIKLGGNGIAVCMLVTYMETFGNDKYLNICEALGNGILRQLDRETGKYYHVLYHGEEGQVDFTRKAEYRTVYYDGECTYALCSLYRFTRDQTWLDAAAAAVENFIREDYIQYRDHWVAYSVNEITKHIPDERYFTFGLRNVQENLAYIYDRKTAYFTFTELLMASYDMYERLLLSGQEIAYFDEFNEDAFIETIFHRSDLALAGYFYPEYAIYMADPPRIMDVVFIRNDSFRVRIDDVQHFVGGYHQILQKYESLLARRANAVSWQEALLLQ